MSLRKAVKDVLDSYTPIDNMASCFVSDKAIKALRQAYADPYVPMSIFECYDVANSYDPLTSKHLSLVAHIESAVLAKLGVKVGK